MEHQSSRVLHIGLLQCGHVHPDLVPANGDYPKLFADLLGHHGVELTTIDVSTDPLPDLHDLDGWLISGSADSVYDPLPWIPAMEDLVRRAIAEPVPLVGICFGHQLVAQALGTPVGKADSGWGVGAIDYDFFDTSPPWMRPAPRGPVRLLASHQDQVQALPDGAELLARSARCPIAGYRIGEHALCIQPHPEFTKPVSRGLVERRLERIGAERSAEALDSFDEPLDADLVAGWIAGFFRGLAR